LSFQFFFACSVWAFVFVLVLNAQVSAPVTAVNHNNRGVALMTQQSFEAALNEFKAAAEADPKLTPAIVNQGIALYELGRMDDAEQIFQKVLTSDPDNVRAHFNMGLVYRSQGKLADALEEFEAAQKLAPNDAHTEYFIATIQFQQGNYGAAADHYTRSIDLDPLFASAYFGASRAYTALGQSDRARIYQDRFQTLTQGSLLSVTVGNQYGEQGPYGFAEEADVLASSPTANIDVHFTDVSARYGLRTTSDVACIVDFDRDGLPDIFIGDSLYRNRGNRTPRFQKVATLQTATACAVGDYDNDDYPDLLIATTSDAVLYHNNKGRFVLTPIGTTGTASAVAFVDLDHDGWLDLVVGARAFRNKADGTFSEIQMPRAPGSPLGIIPTDYDNDRDIDLLLTSNAGPAAVFSNNRDGTFTRTDIRPELTANAVSAVVLDFNKDGWMDFFLTRAGKSPVLLRNSPTQRFTALDLPVAADVTGGRGASIDFDNDGFIDLVFVGQSPSGSRMRLLRNLGSERFEDVSERTGLNRIRFNDARNLIAADLDNDGDTDLVITQAGAPPVILQNDGGNKNGSLKVTLKGFKDNHSSIGTKVEIHGERLRQKVEVSTPGPILFGTGKSRADFVRMLWPTGVVQDEIPGERTRVEYQELDRKGSSCPTLYSWDGTKFRFISDIIGPGVIGEWEAPGQWNASDTDEYMRLNPGDVHPIDGKYRFKVLSQMEEVTYLDSLKLVAIDTPESVDVYNNDRYQPVPPYPEFKLWQVSNPHAAVSVVDGQGRDLSKEVAAVDGVYAPVPKITNYPGFAASHSIIIDVGEIPASGTAQLILSGYTEYFDSTTAHSAYYSGIEPVIPYLEVADGKGNWVRKNESIGIPAGLPKTIVVDLSGIFSSSDHRVRITDNMEIYWDRILVNTFEGTSPIRVTTLLPQHAELQFGGYPQELRKRPESYDYQRSSPDDAFQLHRGNYTRYGDITTLMKAPDDMYAVMASGDEVTADFNGAELPPLPAGWHRTFLVYADGYEKAMETYTPFPDTVAPLPFHKMSKFPYPTTEHYPDDPDHVRYLLEYNTRHIESAPPAGVTFRRQPPNREITKHHK
jgi:Tfp pilus assembly protein PilF